MYVPTLSLSDSCFVLVRRRQAIRVLECTQAIVVWCSRLQMYRLENLINLFGNLFWEAGEL